MRFAADENFNNRILRGLVRRLPELDIVRVQDTELYRAADSVVLMWAVHEERVLLTHDEKTMPYFAYEQMRMGKPVAGVIIVERRLPIGLVIEELEIIAVCSTTLDWVNRVQYLPL
jgi:predicted nuclease of predicted toxin-antitoxin system